MIAKDRSGEIVPYHHPFHLGPDEILPVRRWRDGSLESNLPMIQLKELFNVNHFIVCQANPHIAPFLFEAERDCESLWRKFRCQAEMEVKHRCQQLLDLDFLWVAWLNFSPKIGRVMSLLLCLPHLLR
ncbi:hypothetical protein MKX03_005015 [Papaver bracteatum]|nr:hypothetical protein MKX03_005015 [Papaver bracteatum]